MRSENQERKPLPIPCNGQRALPDAWRQVALELQKVTAMLGSTEPTGRNNKAPQIRSGLGETG